MTISTALNRRRLIQIGVGLAVVSPLGRLAQAQTDPYRSQAQDPYRAAAPMAKVGLKYPYSLPPLGYAYTAVEPNVDAETMELHHGRHHAAAITALNKALESTPELHGLDLAELLSRYPTLPAAVQGPIRDSGGSHYNHTLFWRWLAPGGSAAPVGASARAITAQFGSVTDLQAAIKAAGLAQFGSGWAWLALGPGGKLSVVRTANQDTPLIGGQVPVLGIDVWEHAYYLKHRNRRADYLDASWKALNWDAVETSYQAALQAF